MSQHVRNFTKHFQICRYPGSVYSNKFLFQIISLIFFGIKWHYIATNLRQPSNNSINLLAFYHECRSLIGYTTHYLFCDSE